MHKIRPPSVPFWFVPQEKGLIWQVAWGWNNMGKLILHWEIPPPSLWTKFIQRWTKIHTQMIKKYIQRWGIIEIIEIIDIIKVIYWQRQGVPTFVLCSMFIVHCSLFIVHCSLFYVLCSLFFCSLFSFLCSLFSDGDESGVLLPAWVSDLKWSECQLHPPFKANREVKTFSFSRVNPEFKSSPDILPWFVQWIKWD